MMVMRMWHMNIPRAVRQVVAGVGLFLMFAVSALAQNTLSTLLPNGEQQFLDNNGNPLAAGKVYMYVPNTSTFKNTWTDSGQATLNTNPIILDAGGRAIIYGTGIYRQLVRTSANVDVYDALTSATNVATVLTFVGGTSTGSANLQAVTTVETAGFALANKPTVYFNPGFTNTSSMTLNVDTSGFKSVFKPSFSGPVALTGGEVIAGQLATVTYDGTQWILQVDTPYLGISTSLSSATTTNIGTVASHVVQITGTTTITSLGTAASADFPIYLLRFSSALTLTHNATSLILPGGSNITTTANDTATAQYLGSGNWQIIQYQKMTLSAPTAQRLTSSGTYTATSGTTRVHVRMCAAGGGGGGATANVGAAGSANTVFGTWTALPGSGGNANNGAGGDGASGGATGVGTLVYRVDGGDGGPGSASGTAGVSPGGGIGGSGPFGGAGKGGRGTGSGSNAAANSCAGGGGGGGNAGASGGGGGAGEYVEFWATVAQASGVSYSVGTGGTGGAAGGTAGGNGADGIIVVEEFGY